MRQEIDPNTIVRTGDFIGLEGFRVVIRKWPRNGGFGSGRKGVPHFGLSYRPGEERGHTVLRYSQDAECEVRMARVSAIRPPDGPFETTYTEADGKLVSFEIQPGFLRDVIMRANIRAGKLQRVPPPRFVINRSVEFLCSLLMQETESGAQLGTLYFESLAKALVIAVVSQTDSQRPSIAGTKC